MNKHKNIVFCDGGLSNRLNALIFALVLEKRYETEWEIAWPINNWCASAFEDLFISNIKILTHTLTDYLCIQNDYLLLMHENQCNFNENKLTYTSELKSFSDCYKIINRGIPIFYYNNLVPKFVELNEIQTIVNNINISPKILVTVKDFIKSNSINRDTIGIHIRKTDFGNTINESEIFSFVLNSDKKFFICSDDPETNYIFSTLSNASVFKKNNFPVKINHEGGWNDSICDDQGRIFSFNVYRSSDSIHEALIDMLILSQTNSIATSQSTFLNMSKYFSTYFD